MKRDIDPIIADLNRYLDTLDADAGFDDWLADGCWAETSTAADKETLHGSMLDLLSDLIADGDERVIEWARDRYEGSGR